MIMCQVISVRSNMWVENIAEWAVLYIPIYNLPQHIVQTGRKVYNSETLRAKMVDAGFLLIILIINPY